MVKFISVVCGTISMLCIVVSPVWAVHTYKPKTTDPISESWRWHSIAELNGKDYRCMAEGTDKSMWFGIDEGVMRYDGINWTLFTPEDGLAGAPVTALCVAIDGSIYAGSDQGISRFKNGTWQRVFPLRNEYDSSIAHIYQTTDGSVWVGTDLGALRIKNDQFTLYTVESVTDQLKSQASNLKLVIVPHQSKFDDSFAVFSKFFQDQQGALWFGWENGIIIRHELNTAKPDDPSAWQIFTQQEGLDIGIHPSDFLQLSDGSIWCISNYSRIGVNVYRNNRWSHFSLIDEGGTDIHTSIIETPDGAIWIGGFRMLHVFKNGKWHVFNRPSAPIPAARMDLLYSSDGSVWIAGWMSDVVKLDYLTHRWTTYNDLNYECETPDKTQWFIAWDSGVVSYNTSASEWKKYTVKDGLIDAPVRLIATRAGELVAAGSHRHIASVAHFNGHNWTRHNLEEMGWGVNDRAVFESSDGSIWFGGDSPTIPTVPRGVMRYHPSKGLIDNEDAWTFYQHPLLNEVIHCFGETSDGRIWNGDLVLSSFDGLTNTPIADTEALANVNVECMFTTPDRHLWVGTRGKGVFKIDSDNWKQQTVQDGLVSNNIGGILVDSQNSVWAGTMNGISRFDGNTWITKAMPDAMYIEPQNGSIRQSLDGAIWINNRYREWSRRGYSSTPIQKKPGSNFQTTCYQPDTQPPNTRITMYEKKVSQPGNAILAWEGDDPWNITPKGEICYSYRLDDEDWSAYTTETQHISLSIKSGFHRFEVRSRDKDLNVDPTPAVVEFKVIAPLYKQAWFIGMILLFLGIIAYFGYNIIKRDKHLYISNANLKEKTEDLQTVNQELEVQKASIQNYAQALKSSNEELEQFAYVASHDLQEPLRMVSSYMSLLGKRNKDKLDSDSEKFINYAVDGAKRMQILINDLLSYSRVATKGKPFEPIEGDKVIERVLMNLKIVIEERKAKITYDSLPTINGDSVQMERLMQNLIGNAIKYCEKTPDIHISAEQKDGVWQISIKDNGIGIDPKFKDRIFGIFQRLHGRGEYSGTGIGLAVCKKIVEGHGGKIWVESEGEGKGSTFYFTVPEIGNLD